MDRDNLLCALTYVKWVCFSLGLAGFIVAILFVAGCATEREMNELYGDYDCIAQIDGEAFCR